MMTDDEIRVALQAMRSDAEVWNSASSNLREPVSATTALKLTGSEMSFFATERGLDTTYEAARVAIEDMLKRASQYFRKISDNLEGAAQQYENDDANAANDMQHASQGN